MCLAHTVKLVSVFVILFCSTEGKPMVDVPVDDNEFLELLGGEGSGVTKSQLTTCPCGDLGGDDCKCVPFHTCSDPRPENIPDNYGCFNINPLIDERTIIDPSKSPCPILELCCKCKKGLPTTKVQPTEPPPPPPQSQCGKRNPKGVGVTNIGFTDGQSQVGEFPWMVAVLGKDTTYVAGGSLVHPWVILTAGHKVDGKKAGDLVVRIGDWDLNVQRENPEPQNIGVDRIVRHPNIVRYDYHENNVALLILKKETVYNNLVMPICLPQPDQNFDGADCFVTGWGVKVFGGKFQKILKKIAMSVISHSQCETALRDNTNLPLDFILHDSMTCAGDQGKDACTGDGGSPLVCQDPNNPTKYIQVGAVSWGKGCNRVGVPGVYSSIPKSVAWITETIQQVTGIDERDG